MADAPRILIVDDDPHLRLVVRRGLAYQGYRTIEAASGEEALEQLLRGGFSLVVLDRMLPGIDGAEVCRRLREAGDDLPVLMLTARDRVPDRVEGLESGADDYLVKPFEFVELLARVHALMRRHHPADAELLRFADLELDVGSRQVRRAGQPVSLTATEFNLLMLLMRNPYRVLPRPLILEKVWDYDFGGDSNVLEVYVRYLRHKLEHDGRSRLIQTVRGVGYVLREDP
jgi:two-component system, OmpR family, response regulator MprA